MSDSKSPNRLLAVWPNRFYKTRMRNIRWTKDMVKCCSLGTQVQEEDANSSPNANVTSYVEKRTIRQEDDFITRLEEQFNAGSASETTGGSDCCDS